MVSKITLPGDVYSVLSAVFIMKLVVLFLYILDCIQD
jgi:hypothetical protein